MELLANEVTTPATCDWLGRFKERSAVKTMLSKVVRPQMPPGGFRPPQQAQSQPAQRAN
jgi:hypothetical protein